MGPQEGTFVRRNRTRANFIVAKSQPGAGSRFFYCPFRRLTVKQDVMLGKNRAGIVLVIGLSAFTGLSGSSY